LLDGVVSAMRKCEELLNNGVSAMEENGKRLLTVVFQQWGKSKVLNSGVSAMGKVNKC
jgi:hypothetical protein